MTRAIRLADESEQEVFERCNEVNMEETKLIVKRTEKRLRVSSRRSYFNTHDEVSRKPIVVTLLKSKSLKCYNKAFVCWSSITFRLLS